MTFISWCLDLGQVQSSACAKSVPQSIVSNYLLFSSMRWASKTKGLLFRSHISLQQDTSDSGPSAEHETFAEDALEAAQAWVIAKSTLSLEQNVLHDHETMSSIIFSRTKGRTFGKLGR